jgi:5-methylcytosine-specific restriction enzyme subunit McrC
MIKIQNIYYMLAYAFQVLREESYARIALENFEHVEDLLAAILAKGIANQIKRGLGRAYISQTDVLSSPHGKINISDSIKKNTMDKKRLACEFDEYSENTVFNRILKSTALRLICSADVEQDRKKALITVLRYFSTVDTIKPRDIRWGRIQYNRSNATYQMLINLCYLVFEALLPTTQQGADKLSRFKDDNLHRLFEKFVLEYYKKHHPTCRASASCIDWNTDDGVIDLLPQMKTDITLQFAEKTLIIDTKYYGHTLQMNDLYHTRSIHSANLYQIFAYVKNKDIHHSGNVSGLLLYAKTDEEITPDQRYLIDGNRINVRTLDLDKDFTGIRIQLDHIIKEWLG